MADLSDIQATDAVRIVGATSTGLEQTPVNSSLAGDMFVKDVINVSGVEGAISLSTTAVEVRVGGSRLTGRKSVTIRPTTGDIYWGFTSGVTTTTGTPIYNKEFFSYGIDDAHTIYIIATGAVNVRITEG